MFFQDQEGHSVRPHVGLQGGPKRNLSFRIIIKI